MVVATTVGASMTVPVQRETLLKLFQDNADADGNVRLSVDEIFAKTGIPIHDIAKTSWGLQKEQKLRFKESKAGRGSGGRTRSILRDFQLLPTAWNDRIRVMNAEKKQRNKESFEAIVSSISSADVANKTLPSMAPPIVEEKAPLYEVSTGISSETQGPWATIRENSGRVRHGVVKYVDSTGRTFVRDMSGHVRGGTAEKTYPSRPSFLPSTKRKRRTSAQVLRDRAAKTRTSSSIVAQQNEDLGWAKIQLAKQRRYGRIVKLNEDGTATVEFSGGIRRRGKLLERFATAEEAKTASAAATFSSRSKGPLTPRYESPVEKTQVKTGTRWFSVSRNEYPRLSQLADRDLHLLSASESLRKAGLVEEADRVLLLGDQYPKDSLEGELARLISTLSIQFTD